MANKCEYDAAVDNSDEDVFANPELLLEVTKFDDSNDVELQIKPLLLIPHFLSLDKTNSKQEKIRIPCRPFCDEEFLAQKSLNQHVKKSPAG